MPGLDNGKHARLQELRMSLSEQFAQPGLYLETFAVLSVAVLLAALLAYHPSTHRKLSTRADFEQPKTMVLYGLVGALVGHIVDLNEAMALVIFGIGGLMRFRTVVGEAKDTGRVILSAIVGICAGLQSYLIAVLATAFAWVIIWYLERKVIGSVVVVGVEVSGMEASSSAYHRLLEQALCRVVGETRDPKRGCLELVFAAPGGLRTTTLKAASDALEAPTRGQPVWDIS